MQLIFFHSIYERTATQLRNQNQLDEVKYQQLMDKLRSIANAPILIMLCAFTPQIEFMAHHHFAAKSSLFFIPVFIAIILAWIYYDRAKTFFLYNVGARTEGNIISLARLYFFYALIPYGWNNNYQYELYGKLYTGSEYNFLKPNLGTELQVGKEGRQPSEYAIPVLMQNDRTRYYEPSEATQLTVCYNTSRLGESVVLRPINEALLVKIDRESV